MKVLNKIVIGAAALVLLTACGPSKVSYAKFHEQAVAAAKKEVSYKKVKFSGKSKTSSTEITLSAVYELKDGKWQMTEGGAVEAVVTATYIAMTADTIAEDEKSTYYAGNGFKVTRQDGDDKATMTWNEYGLLTSAKGKANGAEVDISLKYSK